MSFGMDNFPEPLAELGLQGLANLNLKPLSPPWPVFSIPRLENKPQNPIINNLEGRYVLTPLPSLEPAHISPTGDADNDDDDDDPRDIWLRIKDMRNNYKSGLVSWDTLRTTQHIPNSPSTFISEQAPEIATAVRNPARLLPSSRSNKVMSVTLNELYDALRSTLVGCTSALYNWNASEERFVPVDSPDGRAQIVIDGMDKVITDSYMSRFIAFGTLFRRLEVFTIELRKSSCEDSSATFALAHCLSSALVWIRRETISALSGPENTICDIWVSLEEVSSVLLALASLCSRDAHLGPKLYQPLPYAPQRLLSHIYDFLALQIEQQAPLLVRAVLSFILTNTSRPYFSTLARSLGLIGLEDLLADAWRKAAERWHSDTILDDPDDNGEEPDSELELENDMKEEFPSFMPEEIKDAVVRARRSIRILSSPDFDGSQKIVLPEFRRLEWVWTDDEITRRVLGEETDTPERFTNEMDRTIDEHFPLPPAGKYKTELAKLAIFDLEPGSLSRDSDRSIVDFIASYPACSPAPTPSLPLLAEHVLAPVSAQANALGRAALQHFLTPGTSLHLRAHLVLLRAYLLLTAPAFKARLVAALFSDADEDEDADEGAQENPMAITITTRARNATWRTVRSKKADIVGRGHHRSWPVGLSFGLTRQAEWPPGGSDLAFYLRRVIMDSLEDVRESENMFTDALHKNKLGNDEFWDEGEGRLGFAVRDLPVGTGNEKWLDPTQIEALDFLYMQYKPPNPLRCLITEDILSKYQRVFAFLIRLLRVETAMRTVFRLTRPCSVGHMFADYPDTQSLVLHFRFSAQAFVSALSAYVADTAIRGNIDAFIARVRYAEDSAASHSDGPVGPFADVYALMQRHSRVLDTILAACLLRGAQRAVGDILRALLEAILEFAVLVGNAYRSASGSTLNGTFNEERAAQRIEALYAKFCKTRNALVKALRKIAERGSKPFAPESMSYSGEKLPPSSGGMEALVDLLLRIGDTNDDKK